MEDSGQLQKIKIDSSEVAKQNQGPPASPTRIKEAPLILRGQGSRDMWTAARGHSDNWEPSLELPDR